MGFLGKAKKMIRGSGAVEPLKPQYYQVACPEGHVIRGERTEGYQALRCPHCGDGVFVLPRSPLPLPPAPASARAKARPARAQPAFADDLGIELTDAPPQEDLDEILWVDPDPSKPAADRPAVATPPVESSPEPKLDPDFDFPVDPPPQIPAQSKSKARPKAASAAGTSPRAPAVSPRPVSSRPIERDPGLIVVPVKSRRGGRVVLVLCAVGLIAAATIFLVMRKQRLQELPHLAEVNFNEGKDALEAGRFDEAKLKLGRASKAYLELGIRDETAADAIRFAEEAAILNDLDLDTPKEIVEEVARLDEVEGQTKFDAFHKGRTILINGIVESVDGGRVELRERILIGRGPVPSRIGRWDLLDFKLLKDNGLKTDDSVIFGAKLKSIRLEGREWRIKLEPDSGVWMSNAKALAIGFQEAPPS